MKNNKKDKSNVLKLSDNTVLDFINKYYIPSSDDNITIKEVWDERYRVNVWTKKEEEIWPHIKDSFFIKVRNKEVVFCDPPLNLDGDENN